uniref:Replication protein A 70 kDa DNA-binding subunit n=1 Tax=Tetrahymena thermophila (strain SB210) TaxID=312017 RepID=RFA1_TETTS|nr:RecName: Full=Replication protein A 70 kDa DNA-binding subunit; Short=RP-A p70; AltName: Full=Replication factor A protein 1; Short=RF-A protein 1 [Tetrahymena thermophila SB210]ADB03555.2 replication protein complex A largest subunit [Tetrahymena thermophila]
MVTQLTKNAIDSLINSTNPDEQYVIQVLKAPQSVAENLFKICISDGFCKFKKGYFVSDAATKCQDLKDLCIIKCKKYIDDSNHDKERIIISNYELIYSNIQEQIGKPIEYKQYKSSGFSNPEGSTVIPSQYLSRNAQILQQNQVSQPKQMVTPPVSNINKPTPAVNNTFAQKPAVTNQNIQRVNQNPQQMNKTAPVKQNNNNNNNNNGNNKNNSSLQISTDGDEQNLEYIRNLQPNGQPQTIKVRITKKGDLKSFKEKQGKLFSIDVIDKFGDECSISFFNEIAEQYDGLFKVGQVIVLKQFSVKVNNNHQYNKGDHTVTVNKESKILICQEDPSIPMIKLNRQFIQDMQNKQKGDLIDLIVVVKADTEVKTMILKKDNQQQSKRDIISFDESLIETEITLWGETAKDYDAKQGDIIVFKDAKIGEFKDKKQINIGYGTQIFMNPDEQLFPQIHDVKKWYLSLNSDQLSTIQKAQGNDTGPREVTSFESSLNILKEEIKNLQTDPEMKIWKEIRGQIMYIKDTPLYYNACFSCKKKIARNNEVWTCINCNKDFNEPDSRYILSLNISDSTDTIWVSAFDEVGQKILGVKGDVFRYADEDTEHGTETKKKLLMAAQNKEYRFLLLTKQERDQNGNARDKTVIHAIKDFQPAYEAKKIINSLEKFMVIEENNP